MMLVDILGRTRVYVRSGPLLGAMLPARALLAELPPMTLQERAEVTALHAVGGILHEAHAVHERPFRAPHRTCSFAGMLGHRRRPGEVSLATHGVLYLPEAPGLATGILHALPDVLRAGSSRGFQAEPAIVVLDLSCPRWL